MNVANHFLISSKNILNSINETVGRCVSWLVLAMVLITFCIVVLRYVFNTGWIAMQEAVTYLHATVFLLGAAYTLKQNGHVRVDIFYQKMSPKSQAIIDLLGTLFFLLPVCGFIIWVSWEYVTNAWKITEGSREAGGLPGVFLVKTLILIMASLLIIQGLAVILSTIITLLGLERTDTQQPEA